MSVLIKGITKSDFESILTEARYGANNCMIGNGVEAIELPPHGRLIDADALIDTFKASRRTFRGDVLIEIITAITMQPTIIDAEEGE